MLQKTKNDMMSGVGSILIVAIYCLIALSTDVQCASYKHQDAQNFCIQRTGLKNTDISEHFVRNQNCAIDCTTKQGTVMSFFVPDGTECHDQDGYKCILGKCRSKEEAYMVDMHDLYSIEIHIKSARVPDMDPMPAAGGSDTFISVMLVKNGGQIYNDNEIICHTYVIQDNNNPRWANFVCKPMPMKRSALLRFDAYDSDKPFDVPDHLGDATENLEYLMNNGPTKLKLIKGNDVDRPYYVEVEIKGKKYE